MVCSYLRGLFWGIARLDAGREASYRAEALERFRDLQSPDIAMPEWVVRKRGASLGEIDFRSTTSAFSFQNAKPHPDPPPDYQGRVQSGDLSLSTPLREYIRECFTTPSEAQNYRPSRK
jgi:hypothetical protein